MDALSKILALLFSLITMLGVIPKSIPSAVTLPEMKEEEIMLTVGDYSFSYDKGSFALSLKGNTMFSSAVSEAKIEDSVISSASYADVTLVQEKISDIKGEVLFHCRFMAIGERSSDFHALTSYVADLFLHKCDISI